MCLAFAWWSHWWYEEVVAQTEGGSKHSTPTRLKPEQRPGLVLGTLPKRLIVFPSEQRDSRSGKRAWAAGPRPSAVSQKGGYLTSS